ncbi:MAG: leucine-rich repeat domain-containing protein, partial [Promethearchaeota archaeon]
PESFGNLTKLKVLTLNENKLSALPKSFGQLKSLQTLDLRRNQLNALPETFGNLISLQDINLIGNQLSTLPGSFRNLTTLRKLHLYNRNLVIPLESLDKDLPELQLQDNLFHSSPETVHSLLRVGVNSNPSILREVLLTLGKIQERSPLILSFLTQEGKTLSDDIFFQLFDLVRVDEVSPIQLTEFRPLFLSLLVSLSTPSNVRLQVKQALKKLEDKDIT